MPSLLDRKLVVVTGKGGVGKTTIAAAVGVAAAARGLRTIVVEVGEQQRLPVLFERGAGAGPGEEIELDEGLWATSIDTHRALLEWMETQLGGRVPARLLGSSSTFQYFVAAAPGAREVVTMAKVWELAQSERWRSRAVGYDLVVVDAPATGHALAMLRSPQTFAAIARIGPIFTLAERVREFLDDPGYSAYLGVAQGSEMAVAETLELEDRLRHQLGRRLQAVVVNGVLPRRFKPAELSQLDRTLAEHDGLPAAAARAARSVHRRAAEQQNQVARLRRHRFDVTSIPFVFEPELGRTAVQAIASTLERQLL
jgi:anion-transporting  ArsA/GET3 family ATPase